MTANSQSAMQAVVGAYDFSQFCHVTDIGGGQGQLRQAFSPPIPICAAHCSIGRTVVSGAKDVLAE